MIHEFRASIKDADWLCEVATVDFLFALVFFSLTAVKTTAVKITKPLPELFLLYFAFV